MDSLAPNSSDPARTAGLTAGPLSAPTASADTGGLTGPPSTDNGTGDDGPVVPRFGRYEVLELIGSGGMGVVWKARDRELGLFVALKTLHGGPDAPATLAERFLTEAKAAARLRHANIVPIHHFDRQDGCAYFTIPLLPAGSLARHRERFRAPPAAVALIEQVARGVHHAHEHGVLHRDLKPGNFLLDDGDVPRVADFGLAKLLDAAADLTQTGVPMGTPPYMSPEQVVGRAVDARSDVWALGVVLYELLLGDRPFPGTTLAELSTRICSQDPPRPTVLRPGFDVMLEAVVLKCLAKEPAERYQTAGELAEELKRWRTGEAVAARFDPRQTPAARRLRSRRRFLAAGATLGLTAASGGLAWWLQANEAKRRRSVAYEQAAKLRAAEEERRAAALADLKLKFHLGQPVVLVGAADGPAWMNQLTGTSPPSSDPATPMSLFGSPTCMVELLPSPERLSYRVRGQVRLDSGPGYAAIYAGRSLHSGPGIPAHCACCVSVQPPKPQGVVTAFRCVYVAANSGEGYHHLPLKETRPLPVPEGGWWDLELRVTPEFFEASVQDQVIHREPRPDLLRKAAAIRAGPRFSQAQPDFSPLHGLGVVALDATCSARNVVIILEK